MDNCDPKKLAEFLCVSRNLREIAKHFSLSEEMVQKLLLKKIEGYNLFPAKDRDGQMIYRLAPEPPAKTVAPKIWYYDVAKDETGASQPYIQVVVSDDLPAKKLKIYPFGDIHYGAFGHDEGAFRAYLKLLLEKDHAFFVIIGDVIENALASSIGGSVYEQVMPPHAQVLSIREILRPIAHKCFAALPGNHEERSLKLANIDPLEFGVCDNLGIPYFSEPVYLDVLWRGNVFTFFIQHGKSGAQTKGGKLNAASRPLLTNEHTMFTVMGHVHDLTSGKNVKRCREFVRDKNGEVVNMRIVERVEYVIICPSTYRFFSTYASRAGYSPVAQSTVIACVLKEDGTYYLDEKPLEIEKPQ